MRTEYKILIFTLVVVLVIILIFAFKDGAITKLVDNFNEGKLTNCTSTERMQGVKYVDHTCTVTDETGRVVQLSYPEIKENGSYYKNINNIIKGQFLSAKETIEYEKIEKKYTITNIETISYKIYSTAEVLSILVTQGHEQAQGVKAEEKYQTYSIDLKNKTKLTSQDVLKYKKLGVDFSAKLKRQLIVIYANELGYSYYDVPSSNRNKIIDAMLDNTSYDTIGTVYLDEQGRVNFILELYNQKQYHTNPYYFVVDSNGNITYSKDKRE